MKRPTVNITPTERAGRIDADIRSLHASPGRSTLARAKRAEQLLMAELALARRRYRRSGAARMPRLAHSGRAQAPAPRTRHQIRSSAMYPGGVRVLTDGRECPRV
jgi:hypothetical protein